VTTPPPSPISGEPDRDAERAGAGTGTALRRALGTGARHVAGALGRLRAGAPTHLAGYRGYASGSRALVLGRALRGAPLAGADAAQSRWRNLLDSVRRIESDPLRNARVHGRIGDTTFELQADDEGFVHQWVPLARPLAPGGWHPVHLSLDVPPPAPAAPATATPEDGSPDATTSDAEASVLAPAATARYGVISDLDDTVLQSDATRLLRAARLLLLENARTRLPFPGVAALYRALVAGETGDDGNPLFYVSSSPWNLYDVIADFLDVQEIPPGPVLLRDWDLGRDLFRHGAHKRAAIGEILESYPALPFVLVGDSGQEDPEVYREIVRDFPGRVRAVYIRSVTRTPARLAAVEALAAEVAAHGSTLLLADDTEAMAAHAAAHGWMREAAVAAVHDVAEDDAARPAPDDVPPLSAP
jgi:phosphatidate phosphatase APP1